MPISPSFGSKPSPPSPRPSSSRTTGSGSSGDQSSYTSTGLTSNGGRSSGGRNWVKDSDASSLCSGGSSNWGEWGARGNLASSGEGDADGDEEESGMVYRIHRGDDGIVGDADDCKPSPSSDEKRRKKKC